jgi:hypothetical protein
MRELMKGQIMSEETRKKISVSKRNPSAETRAKISAAARRRYAAEGGFASLNGKDTYGQ